MSHLENEILSIAADELLCYKHYIDDVFGVWNGPNKTLKNFLDKMHKFHDSMDFTLEIGDSSLHYLDLDLDLQLTPSSNGLRIEFDIFRKNTYCGTSIHNLSLHPHRHKAAVVNYYIPVSYTHLTLPTIYSV